MKKLIALFLAMFVGMLGAGRQGELGGAPAPSLVSSEAKNDYTLVERRSVEYISSERKKGSGNIKQISVGSKNNIWATDTKDFIYRWEDGMWRRKIKKWDHTARRWDSKRQQLGGRLNYIAAGPTGHPTSSKSQHNRVDVWGVSDSGGIYQIYNKGDGLWRWTKTTRGNKWMLSIGKKADNRHVFGINRHSRLYRMKDASGVKFNWREVTLPQGKEKQAQDVSIGSDGTLWLITGKIERNKKTGEVYTNRNGNIYEASTAFSNTPVWTDIPGAKTKIAVGTKKYIFGVNAQGNVYQWHKARSKNGKWSHTATRFKTISIGSDGTLWGIGKNGKIYEFVENFHDFFRRRLEIINSLATLSQFEKFDNTYIRPSRHSTLRYRTRLSELKKKLNDPFYKKNLEHIWLIGPNYEWFKEDIVAIRNNTRSLKKDVSGATLVARLKLNHYKRLAGYNYRGTKRHDAFKNSHHAKLFLNGIKNIVNNRHELIKFPTNNQPSPVATTMRNLMDEMLKDETTIQRKNEIQETLRTSNYKSGQYADLGQLKTSIQSIIDQINFLRQLGSDDRRKYTDLSSSRLNKLSKDLFNLQQQAGTLVPLDQTFTKINNQFNESTRNIEVRWLNDYQQRERWINMLRYLVNNMFGHEFTQMLKQRVAVAHADADQPGASGISLGDKIPIEETIMKINRWLTSQEVYSGWRDKFTSTQRSLLENLIEVAQSRISQEKTRIAEAAVKTFMERVDETKEISFLITAVEPGKEQTMLFNNLEKMQLDLATRPLNEIENYLSLINKLEEYLANRWFNFDPPARKNMLTKYINQAKQLYLTLLQDVSTRGKITAAARSAFSADTQERAKYEAWLKTTQSVLDKITTKQTRTPTEIETLKNLLTQLNDPNTGLKGLFPIASQPALAELITKLETVVALPTKPTEPAVMVAEEATPELVSKAFNEVKEAFDDFRTKIHASPERLANWLAKFELLANNKMLLAQQDELEKLLSDINRTMKYRGRTWFGPFSDEQKTKFNELMTKAQKTLTYRTLADHMLGLNLSAATPAALINLTKQLLQTPGSKLEENKGEKEFIIELIKEEADDRFSATEKTQLNLILAAPTTTTTTVKPATTTLTTAIKEPQTPPTATQEELWRGQLNDWTNKILNWRGIASAMDLPTAQQTNQEMSNIATQMESLEAQELPADLRNLLNTSRPALKGTQQLVQNRMHVLMVPVWGKQIVKWREANIPKMNRTQVNQAKAAMAKSMAEMDRVNRGALPLDLLGRFDSNKSMLETLQQQVQNRINALGKARPKSRIRRRRGRRTARTRR